MKNGIIGIVLALLAVVPNARAGILNVDGNLTVASNLAPASVTLGGQMRTTWPTSSPVGVLTNGQSAVLLSGVFRGNFENLSKYSGDARSLVLTNDYPSIVFDSSDRQGGWFGRAGGNGVIFLGFDNVPYHRCFYYFYQSNRTPLEVAAAQVTVNADLAVSSAYGYGNLSVGGDATIDSKLTVYGGMDPPYLLLDSETRVSIANRVAREVSPSKQSGAALFWNGQTKQLETYVASEGAYYDLAGKLVASIKPPAVADATVTRTYRIDPVTGTVVLRESVRAPRWQVKPGYQLDSLTGTFTRIGGDSNATPVTVNAQEALEFK